MDLNHRGNPIKAQDGPTDLLCAELICCVALVQASDKAFICTLFLVLSLATSFTTDSSSFPGSWRSASSGTGSFPLP